METASAVSSGGTWYTPNPSWGISTPLLSRIVGTVATRAPLACGWGRRAHTWAQPAYRSPTRSAGPQPAIGSSERRDRRAGGEQRSEEHTSELQSRQYLV